jgi:hypothetical protein
MSDKMAERSRARRSRMVFNRAESFAAGEQWDLEFWQSLSAEARIAALESIRLEYQEFCRVSNQ